MTGLLVLMMILSTIIPVLANEVPTPDISQWAVETLNEGEKYGIYPMEWYYDGFRSGISQERIEALVEATEEKLAVLGLEKKEGFVPVSSKGDSTRGDVITRLYNVLAQYELEVGNSPAEYLQERKILQGTAKGLELDNICTTEQAVVLATRLIKDTYGLLDAGSKGLAWKVENNGNTVYLLGSIHIGSSELYPIDEELKQAFDESDVLVVEANILNQQAGLQYFMQKATYQDGTTIKDAVSPETYDKLVEVLAQYQIPVEALAQFKPWSLANNLQVLSMENSGDMAQAAQSANLGIDVYFLLNAYLTQKPIAELEGIELQADLFDGLTMETQLEYLNGVLDGILAAEDSGENASAELLKQWIEMWINGDVEEFSDSFGSAEEASQDEFSKMLFGERDKNMAEKIKAMLESEEKGTYFIVVGAGHLVQPNTIIQQLEEAGYTVELFNEVE